MMPPESRNGLVRTVEGFQVAGRIMETMSFTKDEVLKKMITRASDGLVLDVYARIQQDRRPWGDQWIRPGAVKSWTELVHEALREGALTIEEAAFLLVETRR
jgi:hypothetical protein